ncbi:histidinol-phosphate/aromatic aminotransferase/cobyric acid decarboxylase-like protein [Mycetocola sp. BIGb0189]|uniref:aminotransferase class I/II-fold pyridoxal phosphate-dependent enzyme n=1 Tax=Mycetocola sp. BIGb0189 TaxID=2940604 RepID=UPI0021690429|nr:aminotransferase class I/II-fold pyridoxal phosphate-dependent enzyme [Mycetocola sp. BIGb0189]MCS4277841.1 histidinol-phosphate/aromatic aminotransferase/cobyric acid decarboxylase-like protein [Mycetocola sp. BIGb0189]
MNIDRAESPFDLPRAFRKRVLNRTLRAAWNSYPAGITANTLTGFAKLWQVPPAVLRFSASATAAIDNLVVYARQRGMTLWYPDLSYPGFDTAVRRHGVHHVRYPPELRPWQFQRQVSDAPRLILINYPGNPIGPDRPPPPFRLPPEPHPHDEYIVDFSAADPFGNSFTRYVQEAQATTTTIVFSLSKVPGLAGARLGGTLFPTVSAANRHAEIPMQHELDVFQIAVLAELATASGSRVARRAAQRICTLQDRITHALSLRGFTIVNSTAPTFTTVLMRPDDNIDVLGDRIGGKVFASHGLLRIPTTQESLAALRHLEPRET